MPKKHIHIISMKVTVEVGKGDQADYKKRSPALPAGCKDVNDVVLPARIVVREFWRLVHQKPHIILSDLMALGIFVSLDEEISFDVAAQLACKYGYKPIRKA